MVKASWRDTTLVQSDDIALVEGNAYFLLSDVDPKFLKPSDTTRITYCHWKGFAEYFDVHVDGQSLPGAAFVYRNPYQDARTIEKRVAFWAGVQVSGAPEGRGFVEPLPSKLGDRRGWEALCWLIKFSEGPTLTAREIHERAGIVPEDLERTWQHFDVQRYALVYKRCLLRGETPGAQLSIGRTA